MRVWCAVLTVAVGGCASGAAIYLPSDPGSTLVDLSSRSQRESWVEAHADEPAEIREAILAGVFVEGMGFRHVQVLSNPRRAGVTGGGFWRHFTMTGETRYRWYVSGERQPFDDGEGRPVCELVFADDSLRVVRYCEPGLPGGDAGVEPEAGGEDDGARDDEVGEGRG